MSNSKKISNFTAQSAFLDGDQLNIVRNGTNFKIDISTLAAFLGVTGTIQPVGGSGAPVLEQPSTAINNIRNLQDGKGTQVLVTAENGLKVNHNFVNGAAGVGVIKDLTSQQTLFRSILAGTGINVAVSGDAIQIGVASAAQSTKTVLISVEGDFPTPAGGVITLAADTDYLLLQDITTSNRFLMKNNTLIRAADSSIVTLTYTGSDTMFTGVNASNKITKLRIDCPSGQLLDMSATSPGFIFQLVNASIMSCDTIGSITSLSAMQITDVSWEDIKSDGISFFGGISFCIIELNLIVLNGGDFLDLGTATFDGFTGSNSFATIAGGTTLLKGAAASANINSGGLGVLLNTRISGAGSPLSGITSSDSLWNFFLNDDVADTRADALTAFTANASNTVIASTGVPVLIAGTWVEETVSQFTTTAAGRVTYNGGKPVKLPVTLSISSIMASGGAANMALYVAVNGSVVLSSKATNSVDSSTAARTTLPWQLELQPGDFIEAFVENNSSTVDILVIDASIRAN